MRSGRTTARISLTVASALLVPAISWADNCSGLSDCFPTATAAALVLAALVVAVALLPIILEALAGVAVSAAEAELLGVAAAGLAASLAPELSTVDANSTIVPVDGGDALERPEGRGEQLTRPAPGPLRTTAEYHESGEQVWPPRRVSFMSDEDTELLLKDTKAWLDEVVRQAVDFDPEGLRGTTKVLKYAKSLEAVTEVVKAANKAHDGDVYGAVLDLMEWGGKEVVKKAWPGSGLVFRAVDHLEHWAESEGVPAARIHREAQDFALKFNPFLRHFFVVGDISRASQALAGWLEGSVSQGNQTPEVRNAFDSSV